MTDTKTSALAEAMLVFDSWSRPPLTEHQRLGWRQRHGIVRVVQRHASSKARQAGRSKLGACRASLTWFDKTRSRRDATNIVPTRKAMCVGLVDAGVVPDDIPALMDKPRPRIVYFAEAELDPPGDASVLHTTGQNAGQDTSRMGIRW